MEYVALLLVTAFVFGLCFLLDKGFTKIFRSRQQHKSGLSVRLNKRYASIGLLVGIIGASCLLFGMGQGLFMPIAGVILVLTGIALVTYYMTFGVFYDADGFVLTTFGRRSKAYLYADIQAQQLYTSYANVIIELYMTDGRAVQLSSAMTNGYAFLDYAFDRWLQQTGKTLADCPFHNKKESCWFPPVEG